MEPKWKYIMYLHQPMGSFTFLRVTSQKAAKAALIEYGEATGFYQELQVTGEYGCTGALYPYDEQSWEDAQEFGTTGCPFDHPEYEVLNGPRGGVRVVRCV